MRRRLLAGFALVTMLAAACSPDATAPVEVRSPGGPQASHETGDAALAAFITTQLTCLYTQGLLPNAASSTGKFNAIKTQLAAGDLQGALDGTANLVRFIELKYSQYSGPATISCGSPIGTITVLALKNDVISNLWSYVGLDGTICEVPPGAPKICKTGDQTTGLVYFPDNIFTQLTYVALEEAPPQLQFLFDEYPNRVRIVSTSVSDFSAYALKPLVVVCFNDNVNIPSAVLSRLLLGSKHGTPPLTTFMFLPNADFSAYPAEVLAQAQTMCGAAPTPSAFSSQTAFGRFGNRLLDLLLPATVQAAAQGALAFGGVGGSAEQFSDFGVVDPGMNAFGGVGGSAEQFAPPSGAAPSGPSASIYTPATSTVSDTAGAKACLPGSLDPTCTSAAAGGLPSVAITAPGTTPGTPGAAIPNVEVVFQLLPPTAHTPTSSAVLCGSAATVTVATGLDGVATLPCLQFGIVAGYKKLRATVNPTTVDPLACVIDGIACTSTSLRNFLVQTTPGAPALIKTFMPPGPPPFPAQSFSYGIGLTPYVDVSPDPRSIVTDQYGNTVGSGVSVYWSANTSTGSVLDPAAGVTQTGADGTVQVNSWTLGEGLNKLFASLYSNLDTPPAGFLPAEFSASTPTGVPVFTCGVGSSKIDLGPFTIPVPSSILRDITLQMSVTGQSSAVSAYQATLSVRLDSYNGTEVGVGGGIVSLPGNNGSPTAATFHLTTPVPRQTGNHTLWFRMTVTLPPTRKIQLWYNSSFANNSPCKDAKVYSPTYPSPSGVVKAGLSIVATN